MSYRIAGMFGGGKVWQIVVGRQTLTSQNSAILMDEIYQFANFFYFGNSPNINHAKHSHYTLCILYILYTLCILFPL